MSRAKVVIRQIAPPFVWTLASAVRTKLQHGKLVYDTYDEALAAAGGSGYDIASIGEGTVAQFRDEAARARDRYPLADSRTLRQLAAVWRVREACGGRPLRVVDLGGQTGVHYQRLRVHLPKDAIERWDVCETSAVAQRAQESCSEPGLNFYAGLESLPPGDYDLAFSSGTVSSVREPWALCEALGQRAPWMLLDRTPLGAFSRDRVFVLRNPHDAYRVTLPIWFFAEEAWMAKLAAAGWRTMLRWQVPEDHIVIDGVEVVYSGLLLAR